jgi:hypothetical protein
MRTFCLLLAVSALACSAALGDDLPLTLAERLAIAEKVMATTPDGTQHWTVLPNAVVRHKNSGLACGADIGSMPLVMLQTLTDSPVPDGSVDCRYANPEQTAVYDVLAYSPGKHLSGQDAFEAYRTALIATHPEAKPVMTFSVFKDPEARGEAFVITAEGSRRLSFLCVSTVHEWVVAVRFTATPLPPDVDEALIKQMASWLSTFPQAVLYRGMRGVVVKQLAMPDPQEGF